ncbi:MAG: biofilm regulation protein kinase SiaB [Pseudomonadota bacterium]
MRDFDLFGLREHFQKQGIMLSFNGPISRSLIEEVGNALKNYMEAEEAAPSAVMDVFGVYVEMTQNIRHYANHMGYTDALSAATVVVARDAEGRYVVEAGNVVEADDGERLVERVRALGAMDRAELKDAYKAQLREPREGGAISGAGLGLIDMARKASAPLVASLEVIEGGRTFFSLRAVI